MDKDGWRKFLELMAEESDLARLEELSRLLFTAEERDAISKRIRIIEELLKEEKTQREIAADFHLSIAKITRGSNALKEIGPKMKRVLKKKLIPFLKNKVQN
ncbi:MAG: trp operon repressor [Chlamydiia bacterium]|nr:trp operon repressor [Chlamydiia bacterium]MCP5506363.1 trp operon repressor [Chlamydiales bacterium]